MTLFILRLCKKGTCVILMSKKECNTTFKVAGTHHNPAGFTQYKLLITVGFLIFEIYYKISCIFFLQVFFYI